MELPIEEVETSIPARFERIVREFSDRVAVKTADRTWTYAEINAQVNRIARTLLSETEDKAVSIALLLETGVALFTAMLGVLKAGKLFVLVDPSYPTARILSILQDAQAEFVLANQDDSLIATITNSGCRVTQYADIVDKIDSHNVLLDVPPESLATIVYTSGSTGEPKGVVWSHQGLLYRNLTRTRECEASEKDRMALLSSHTGNAVNDIFLALLNGATLLPFDVRRKGVVRLGSWMSTEGISICAISSPLFRKLCEALTGTESFPNLRSIRLRSDTVRADDVSLFKKFLPPRCVLITGLASSESGHITTYRVERNSELISNEVPVGYPVAGTEVLLLDDKGRRVEFGRVGEIVVHSRYFSLGYWHRPELTEAKFKPDPEDPTKRFYFTGDLGLMRPDGCLIHKGRKDFRVKIRGYGVELGDVERAFLSNPAVSEVVVATREDVSGETRLIAYYTTKASGRLSVSALRQFIIEKLPDYMIPAAFVRMDVLPLTNNGKVDRRALPDPSSCRPELETPFLSPRTDAERTVARIFSECTGIDRVGIEDNFFDLGGDSLLLARLVSRLSVAFQREFTVSELFECSSVARIVRLLEEPTQSTPPKVETIPSAATSNIPNLLSFAQQRLWFLDQLNPGDPAYSLLSAFQINGALNIAALEHSLNKIIARHEVLRTVFESVDGEPRLKVLANVTISLNIVNLGKRKSVLEDEADLRRYCVALARKPFDLNRGPLLRVSLLRRSDDNHVLVFAVHHVVFDGWSMGVLWSELSACYAALSREGEMSLPKLAVQYGNYAGWQREWFQNQVLQEQLEYWRRQLAGSTALQLMTDRPRPHVQTSRGAKRYFTLSVELSTKLKRLSHDRGATLFMALLAAFQTLLHRYTAQDDIAIGIPVAGRNRSEVENLIGFFLNMLIFRVDSSGAPTFLELLDRVREICLAAYSHQDLPFEKLVEELHPERHLNRNPMVDVTFAFQNTPHVTPKLGGASVSQLDVDSGISRFDLQLFMEETGDHLRGYFSYNTDLFHDQTIGRMAEHFINLLDGIVARPEQTIDQLPLASQAERQRLLAEWNDTERDYPSDKCVHQLFEEQVEKSPDAVALVFEDQQLTYRELNHKANQLAHYLRKRGVRPESLVTVCMERSLEMVIAILSVLKAGGGYVPIDPDSPTDRLKFMLQDTRSPLVLTQERFSSFLAEFADQRICLDSASEHLSLESKENPENQVDEKNAAYMIYTSGSTGTPKGVINVHGGLRNRLQWMQEAYHLTPADRVLQKTPFIFDVSVWELFWPLISGACLVVARPAGHRDSGYLVRLIKSQQITTLHFVPSMLGVFLLEAGVESCTTLRQVFCSGEALSCELQQRFFARTSATLHNLYGPTEASIDVTAWECRRDCDRRVVPIGRPIANTQIYILDQYLAPVPIGVRGEVYIGGNGLARGYLNQPELTAGKFIYHSFSGEPAKRLYRTGDLGRYLPDGNIEFLGRTDTQVKIRGFRIELGEIETVLGQHAAIREAIAMVREDDPGDKRLVGYVVARPQESFDASELRKYLKQKLPEYMIPAALVRLEELPSTPSGKVDRKALPAPDQSRPELEDVYQTPRTPTEETVAAIWSEVLKVAKVGVHHNFFELGGHSLLATQVVSRIRSAFFIEFPLRHIFESPTVAELAVIITGRQVEPADETELAQLLREVEAITEEEAQKHDRTVKESRKQGRRI